MTSPQNALPSQSSMKRISFVDALRGLAILGVVLFHTVWDLRFFGFSQYSAFWDPIWLGFAKVLINTFLGLAGFSLVLAHEKTIHWASFWRRELVLVACAIGISIATFFAFAEGFVYFGVLHAIALFSLMGLVVLRLPTWLVIFGIIGFIAPPFIWPHEAFNVRWLSWIGFWTQHPNTQDLVPIFPAFGAILVGMLVARYRNSVALISATLGLSSKNILWRFLVWCGRKSLIIYLAHQPIVFGLLFVISQLIQPASEQVAANFVAACKQSCAELGQDVGYCTRYCGCAVDQVAQNDLWGVLAGDMSDLDAVQSFNSATSLCTAMAGGPLDLTAAE